MSEHEPGLRMAQDAAGEPLVSEVNMVFEPLTFHAPVLLSEEFEISVGELLGSGAIIVPEYSQSDLRDLAESLGSKGRKVDQKALAGLVPRGVKIIPAGRMKCGDRTVTVNRVTIGDTGFGCNVAGTSAEAKTVLKAIARAIGRLGGESHDWSYYEGKLSRTSYGTATVSQFNAPLRGLFSSKAQKLFEEVEKELSKSMVPQRTGLKSQDLARTIRHGAAN